MADAKDFPSDRADKFLLRLPDGMREEIAESARANSRSMNAEIVARLTDAMDMKGKLEAALPALNGLIESQEKTLDQLRAKDEVIRTLGQLLASMMAAVPKTGLATVDAMFELAKRLGEAYKAGDHSQVKDFRIALESLNLQKSTLAQEMREAGYNIGGSQPDSRTEKSIFPPDQEPQKPKGRGVGALPSDAAAAMVKGLAVEPGKETSPAAKSPQRRLKLKDHNKP